MSQFVKSILNYYAAFTETRFSNKSTLNYQWIDDANLTLDISFFTDFYQLWVKKLESNDRTKVDVCSGQFKREIPNDLFLQKLDDLLKTSLSEECLHEFIIKEKEGADQENPHSLREAFLEGVRTYNLSLRKAIENLVHTLQQDEIAALELQFQGIKLPAPTFNVPKFSQDIYEALRQIATDCQNEPEYFEQIKNYLRGRDYSIILYDLFILLKQFSVVESYGTSYLFFGSIKNEKNGKTPDYPLFFIELSFDSGNTSSIRMTIPRDLVLLNTPAINSFDFQNVLTIPRAASFAGSLDHLRQMDSFLASEYSLSPQIISTSKACSIPPPQETNLPHLKYRFGFQLIKSEDKRILDYSELMTKIEKGEGSTIIDFIDGYLKENVVTTYDETDASFRSQYPKNSASYFYSDNPLPLNTSQKKILTAIGNIKNRIIVIDGPPGTGKSHTIGAITYWANQNNKSILITSHKKEALDVVERMLTDKFKSLHPYSKPSIIRISKSQELTTLNTIENSLSLPVIDGAARRTNDFNLEAIQRDKAKVQDSLEGIISKAILYTKSTPELTKKLYRFLQLEEKLGLEATEIDGKPQNDITELFGHFKEFGKNKLLENCDGITVSSFTGLYQYRHQIPGILKACEALNRFDFSNEAMQNIKLASLKNIDGFRTILERLTSVFEPDLPVLQLTVTEIEGPSNELQDCIASFRELQAAHNGLQELINMSSIWTKISLNKKVAAAKEKFAQDFSQMWEYSQKGRIKIEKLFDLVAALHDDIKRLKGDTPYTIEFVYSLGQQPRDFSALTDALHELNSLRFDDILKAIAVLLKKTEADLTLYDLNNGLEQLDNLGRYSENLQLISDFQQRVGLENLSYKDLYRLLDRLNYVLDTLQPQIIDALSVVQTLYSNILKRVGIDFSSLSSLRKLAALTEDEQNLLEFIELHAELSQDDAFLPEIRPKLDELNTYNHRLTEYKNDLRLKGFQNHPHDLQRIKRSLASGKRLTSEQAKLLCATYSCIIAEPEAIFKFFPMDEGLFEILIFDEASQVSIAHSLSLILRAKQVLVFGDRYQYGAVSAINVSRKYGGAYFKQIIDDYVREYNRTISEEYERRLLQEETAEIADDDLFVASNQGEKNLDADKEWLKTFGIRMSTLDFCQAIINYHGSLTDHFRSFSEIIDYSNEFFYRPAQIPLVVNRIRTKPIDEVLRFIKVETQGLSGKNVNLDEIEAIRQDIEKLTISNYHGTIGIITSFREQRNRAEQYMREKISNYHRLKEENKLTIWFVGDAQGEERDIVYYSFVQDKKWDNADLRTIYPTPGGTADTINSLKMQRLNVGFSRAKDTMVFVHSMQLDEYADSRLGDALKHYHNILVNTRSKDHFIVDESVFESPKEKELYALLIQTDFYRVHQERLKIIPQFNIGKYIQQEYQKYIPKYRVDFLITLADGGKEKCLILEYDGLEYHTKDPDMVRSHEDFKEEYLEYDNARQLELESYGYHFLRINKFTLLPQNPEQTCVDMLNDLLMRSFQV